MSFKPNEVWEMRGGDDDPCPEIYLLLEHLPTQPGSARFAPSDHTWVVLVLAGDRDVGAMVYRQLNGVYHYAKGRGSDLWDNEWERLLDA